MADPLKIKPPITASSLARMAGNIASGFVANIDTPSSTMTDLRGIATASVHLARMIAAEIEKADG